MPANEQPRCKDNELTVTLVKFDPDETFKTINNWILGMHLGINIPHIKLLKDRSKAYIHFFNRNDAINFYNCYHDVYLGLQSTMKVVASVREDGSVVEYPEPTLSASERRRRLEAEIKVHEAVESVEGWLRVFDRTIPFNHVVILDRLNIGFIHFNNRKDCCLYFHKYNNEGFFVKSRIGVTAASRKDGTLVDYALANVLHPKELKIIHLQEQNDGYQELIRSNRLTYSIIKSILLAAKANTQHI